MTEQKIYNINGIDFKQCPDFPRFFVSKEGSYFTKVKGKFSPIKEGVKGYNKDHYPLQAMVCTGEYYKTSKGKTAIKVVNLGKLVLLTWVGVDNSVDPKGYPRNEVDHINRNPFDNRLDNLRWASRNENQQNRRKPVNMDNPYWLNTPEVIAKRSKAKHENYLKKLQQQNETESC